MQVRLAKHDELPVCAALYDAVARETFTWLSLESQIEKFLAEAKVEEVYVVARDGDILGLASFYRPDNFLHSLYVVASARGIGVGGALFDHVRAIADGPISLKVQKLNAAAIDFYGRRAMGICGEGDLDAAGGGWFLMK